MNRNQKEVQQAFLKSEKEILQELNAIYLQAQIDVEDKIFELMNRKDIENLQSIIYQIDYQKALKKQIDSVLDNLNSNQFKSISEYLIKCYNDGFIGTMYDLQGQGLPFIFPIDQKAIVRAVKLDSKINGSMYSHFGENIEELKKDISREIARGISTGTSYQIIGKNIKNNMLGDYKNPKGAYAYAVRIARTEGHRIQIQSTMDAQQKAKEAGANIVKQWDSALDGRTRPTHRRLDGQIRQLNEDFEVEGKHVSAPGMFGDPAEDCNCRCALLQRAKWALDENELKTLKERAEYYELNNTKNFDDYKQKYKIANKTKKIKKDNNALLAKYKKESEKILEEYNHKMDKFKKTSKIEKMQKELDEKREQVKQLKEEVINMTMKQKGISYEEAKEKVEKSIKKATKKKATNVDKMSREELIQEAKEIYLQENSDLGLLGAMQRFNDLISSNSNTYLKKYIKKRK